MTVTLKSDIDPARGKLTAGWFSRSGQPRTTTANTTSKSWRTKPICLLSSIALMWGCASQNSTPLRLRPTVSALLGMIKQISELPLSDLQNAEKTIVLTQLPFGEEIERNGIHGISRFFSLSNFGAPISGGTYWYRNPILPDRRHVYFALGIDGNQFCLKRSDIEMVFGNVWLTGFRNDLMPGAVPRMIQSSEHNFGRMAYLYEGDRRIDFSFNIDTPNCVSNLSLNIGIDK